MKISDAQILMETMSRYDEKRHQWFRNFGTYTGFDAWFRGQVVNPGNPDANYECWCATNREL